MVTIVHHCRGFHPFNGNIFNHFEYFIFLLQHKASVQLHLISDGCVSLNDILNIMEDRYNLNCIDYKKFITFNYSENIVLKYDRVITNSKTIYDLNFNIDANEIHLVHTWASYNSPYKEKINSFIRNKNIISYNENQLVGRINYIRPIYFELLKIPTNSANDIFLHLSGVREINFSNFVKYIYPLKDINQKIIISLPKSQIKSMDFFKKISFVEIYEDHVPNLFEKFNTYIYILLKGFDYSPRMLVECFYLNKKIIFLNKTNINHGGVSRYEDILNNNISKYKLTKNDLLLKNFIED